MKKEELIAYAKNVRTIVKNLANGFEKMVGETDDPNRNIHNLYYSEGDEDHDCEDAGCDFFFRRVDDALAEFIEKSEGQTEETKKTRKIYIIQHDENPGIFLDAFDNKEDAVYALMSMDLTMGDPARYLSKSREELLKEYSIHEAEMNEDNADCVCYAIMCNDEVLELVPTEYDAEHDKEIFQKTHPNDEIIIETRKL